MRAASARGTPNSRSLITLERRLELRAAGALHRSLDAELRQAVHRGPDDRRQVDRGDVGSEAGRLGGGHQLEQLTERRLTGVAVVGVVRVDAVRVEHQREDAGAAEREADVAAPRRRQPLDGRGVRPGLGGGGVRPRRSARGIPARRRPPGARPGTESAAAGRRATGRRGGRSRAA